MAEQLILEDARSESALFRTLYVANSVVASLVISFVEPFQKTNTFEQRSAFLTETDIKAQTGSGSPGEDAAPWVLSRLEDVAPERIVFCRYSGPHARTIVAWARERGVPTIFHIDDDLLDIPIELGAAKQALHMHPDRLATIRYLLAETTLAYCSTPALRRRLFGEADSERVVAGSLYCAHHVLRPPVEASRRVIGYMGTDHSHDLVPVIPALARLLAARSDVAFEIFGSTPMPEPLKAFGDRVRTVPPVRDYAEFMQTLAALDWTIGICALARTPFNAVKADTKWVEYTACGFAVVASCGTVYDACCADGCGRLVEGEDEWLSAFETLLDDPHAHRAQVERAQARLRQDYSPARLVDQIADVFSRARALCAQQGVRSEAASDPAAVPSPPSAERDGRSGRVEDAEAYPQPDPPRDASFLEEAPGPGSDVPLPDMEAEAGGQSGRAEDEDDDDLPHTEFSGDASSRDEIAEPGSDVPPPDAVAEAEAPSRPIDKVSVDDLRGDMILGWAWSPADAALEAAQRDRVELWCGDTRIGSCARTLHRVDVDAHVGDPVGVKGYTLPGGCLSALWLLFGRKDEVHPTLRFGQATASLPMSAPILRDLAAFRTLRSAAKGGPWGVADVWWAGSRLLKLRTTGFSRDGAKPAAVLLRVFQTTVPADGRLRLTVVDEVPLDGRPVIVPIGLRSPLMPVLFTAVDAAGDLVFADLVPFPSLLRGGLHEAEAAAAGETGGTLAGTCRLSDAYLAEAAGWGVSTPIHSVAGLAIDLTEATGAEPIFDPYLRAWLAAGFDLPVAGEDVEARVEADLRDRTFVDYALARLSALQPAQPRPGSARLHLPRDALPTIAAVVSRRLPILAPRRPGPMILTDDAFPNRRWLVSFPSDLSTHRYAMPDADLVHQPVLVASGEAIDAATPSPEAAQPLAIAFRDLTPRTEAQMVFPVAKDQADIVAPSPGAGSGLVSVIVPVRRPNQTLHALLESVVAQVGPSACEVILAVSHHQRHQVETLRGVLNEIVGECARIVEADELPNAARAVNQAADAAMGDVLLFLHPSIVLHDQRSVETLARIARRSGAGTVGCMLLRPRSDKIATAVFEAGGYFPGRIDFGVAPHIGLVEHDCAQILPNATYPVVANGPSCYAVATSAWRAVGGLDERRFPGGFSEIDLSLRLAEAGYANLCTTMLSAFRAEKVKAGAMLDLQVPTNLGLWRLLPAMRASTLIRAF